MARHSEEHVRIILRKVHEMMEHGFSTHALAQDHSGQSVHYTSEYAVTFSIIGAIRRAINDLPEGDYYASELYVDIVRRFEKCVGYDIFFFNNTVAKRPEDFTDAICELIINSSRFYGPDSQKEFVTKTIPLIPATVGPPKTTHKEIEGYKTRLAKWDLED